MFKLANFELLRLVEFKQTVRGDCIENKLLLQLDVVFDPEFATFEISGPDSLRVTPGPGVQAHYFKLKLPL